LDGEERFDDTGGEEDTDTPTHVDVGGQISSEADGTDFGGVSDGPEKSAKGSKSFRRIHTKSERHPKAV
jgi:hypothetical protein